MKARGFLAGAIAACLALSGCAAQKFVLAPIPPVEVRKDEAPSPGPAVGEAAPSPGPTAGKAAPAAEVPKRIDPDYLRMYSEAIAQTKEASRRGQVKDAIPLWKALEGSPWRTDAIFHQGVILHLGGDLDGAADQYRRITEGAPVFEPAAANLMGIHLLRGDLHAVRALVDRILPPGMEPDADMLPELQGNAGAVLLELGDRERAARLFTDLRKKGRIPPSLSWNMAVLAYRNGDTANARRLASEAPPVVERLWPVLASRFAWEREPGKVPVPGEIPAAERRISALAWNIAAFDEYGKGNLKAAESLLGGRKDENAIFTEITSNIGLLQMELGKWKAARGNLEKAVGENPDLPEAWLNLGVFREIYADDAAGAMECYSRYVKLNGSRKDEVGRWVEWLRKSSPRQ